MCKRIVSGKERKALEKHLACKYGSKAKAYGCTGSGHEDLRRLAELRGN